MKGGLWKDYCPHVCIYLNYKGWNFVYRLMPSDNTKMHLIATKYISINWFNFEPVLYSPGVKTNKIPTIASFVLD